MMPVNASSNDLPIGHAFGWVFYYGEHRGLRKTGE
jgi:hypothetical protein